jgi:hypothetical protein
MATKEELLNELSHFTGTEAYHRFNMLFRNVVLTDGAHHLANAAQCFWLMDAIASYLTRPAVRQEPFQTWTLTVKNESGTLSCDDGNGNVLARQRIQYTDFPLDSIKLYMALGDDNWVIMLPTEY